MRLRDLVMGNAAPMRKNRAPKPAAKAKTAKPAKPRVSYSEGLKKKSFKELLAETAAEPEEDSTEYDAPREAAKGGRRERPRSGAGSLLDGFRALSAEGQTLAAGGGTESDKPKAKGWRFPFGFKRK